MFCNENKKLNRSSVLRPTIKNYSFRTYTALFNNVNYLRLLFWLNNLSFYFDIICYFFIIVKRFFHYMGTLCYYNIKKIKSIHVYIIINQTILYFLTVIFHSKAIRIAKILSPHLVSHLFQWKVSICWEL